MITAEAYLNLKYLNCVRMTISQADIINTKERLKNCHISKFRFKLLALRLRSFNFFFFLSINIIHIEDYIKLFLDGEPVHFSEEERSKPELVHYYNEVVRYWNKLNFMVKKTLRSLKIEGLDTLEIAVLLYITYSNQIEGTSKDLLDKLLTSMPIDIYVGLDFLDKLQTFSWKMALEGKSETEKLSLKRAIPSFFIKCLSEVMPLEKIREHHEVMNNIKDKKSFTVFISENIEKTLNLCFIKNLQSEINKNELVFKKDIHIKQLYSVPSNYKSELIGSDLYKSGDLLIVDKGSAAVVDVLDPKPNETIGDLCAAPGAKSYLMKSQTTRIIASDFHVERTKSMRKLLKQMNTSDLPIINTDSIQFPVREGFQFDKILLDAPCTGSGTFLHNPELKWRQSKKFLHQNMVLQEKLLISALELLKPHGILVYSTCSLYPEEGELQIKKVIDKLEPLELPEWFAPSYLIEDQTIPGTGRLFPATHGTQGFFIGKFKKK